MIDTGSQLFMVLCICGAAVVATFIIKLCEKPPEPKETPDPDLEVITVVHKIDKNETPIQVLQRRLASGEIDLDTFHSLVQRC